MTPSSAALGLFSSWKRVACPASARLLLPESFARSGRSTTSRRVRRAASVRVRLTAALYPQGLEQAEGGRGVGCAARQCPGAGDPRGAGAPRRGVPQARGEDPRSRIPGGRRLEARAGGHARSTGGAGRTGLPGRRPSEPPEQRVRGLPLRTHRPAARRGRREGPGRRVHLRRARRGRRTRRRHRRHRRDPAHRTDRRAGRRLHAAGHRLARPRRRALLPRDARRARPRGEAPGHPQQGPPGARRRGRPAAPRRSPPASTAPSCPSSATAL